MTTLSNEDLVAQFGWTIQIISDSTGGRIPAFWRPPYGDTDMRVHSIAQEIFGLTTIIWNEDSSDWELSDTPPPITTQEVETSIQGWLKGPKNPGMIILEHELSNASVTAFMNSYPVGVSNGWQTISTLQGVQGSNNSVWWTNATTFPAFDVSSSSVAPAAAASGSATSTSASGSSSSSGTSTAQSSPATTTSSGNSQSNGAIHSSLLVLSVPNKILLLVLGAISMWVYL